MTNEQLVIRIKAGIDVAENMLQLWQQNQGYINAIAAHFQGYEEMEDLKQQGYIGLCNAVDGYNPDEGIPFIKYAGFWIRKSIQRYIEDCGSMIRIPNDLRLKILQYKKLTAATLAKFGRDPTDQEACNYLNIGFHRLESLRQAMKMDTVDSLDIPTGDEEDGSKYDLLPCGQDLETEIIEKLQQEQLQDALWNMVDELPGQLPDVIRMKYKERRTLREIGERIGCNTGQATKLQNKALRSLREYERAIVLKSIIDGEIYSKALKGNGLGHFNRTWTSSTEYAALERW